MTPSSPAPSKRRNQSSASARSRVAGERCTGGAAPRSARSSRSRRARERRVAQVLVAQREQVPGHERGRRLRGEQLHARRGGMDAQQQRLEVEARAAPRSRSRRRATQRAGSAAASGRDELGEVAVHRLLVAALQQDLVAVAKHERAEAVPLGLEQPALAVGQARRRRWTASAQAAARPAGARVALVPAHPTPCAVARRPRRRSRAGTPGRCFTSARRS